MINSLTFAALWQPVLSFALALFLLLPSHRLSRSMQITLLLVLVCGAVLPLNGISLAIYVRSVIDDLAITTLIALSIGTAVRMGLMNAPTRTHQSELLVCFAVLALILYPATLGLTYLDPYRLGYSPRPLIFTIGLTTLFFLVRGNLIGVLMLSVATLAFSTGLKDSNNYWDYIVDPAFGTYCICAILYRSRQIFIPSHYRRA